MQTLATPPALLPQTLTRGDTVSFQFAPSNYPMTFLAGVRAAKVTAVEGRFVELYRAHPFYAAYWFEVSGEILIPTHRCRHGGEFIVGSSWVPNLTRVVKTGRWM